MGRSTGYWWSPDDTRIAFTRVDESPVAEVERFEILADNVQVIRQRYPAAGTPRMRWCELFVTDARADRAPPVSESRPAARIPTSTSRGSTGSRTASALAVQRQSRDQKTLTLLAADPADRRHARSC